jgi:hypothetical protein
MTLGVALILDQHIFMKLSLWQTTPHMYAALLPWHRIKQIPDAGRQRHISRATCDMALSPSIRNLLYAVPRLTASL